MDEIESRFDIDLDSVKEQSAAAEKLLGLGNATGAQNIWRSQIVLAEGLLDYLTHEMSKCCLLAMLEGNRSKSDKYSNFEIAMRFVEKANSTQNSEWLLEAINEKFSRTVFLDSEHMCNQLNLIGLPSAEVLEKAFPGEKDNKARKRIVSEMFARRNRVAHQLDHDHVTGEQVEIKAEEAESFISNVEALADAIFFVARNTE